MLVGICPNILGTLELATAKRYGDPRSIVMLGKLTAFVMLPFQETYYLVRHHYRTIFFRFQRRWHPDAAT